MKRFIALFILASIALTCFSCGERVTFPDDLDHIEHIGEVPKEFKKVIETDQMRNARFGHGMAVSTHANINEGWADITVFDYYGKKLGSFSVPEDGYTEYPLAYPSYDGNILVIRSPEEDTEGNRMSAMFKYDLKGNVIFRAEVGENIPIENPHRIGSNYYSVSMRPSASDPENTGDICLTKISENGDVKTSFIENVRIYLPLNYLIYQITPDSIKVRVSFKEGGETLYKLYEYDSDLGLISITDTEGNTYLPDNEGVEYVQEPIPKTSFSVPDEIYEMKGKIINYVVYEDKVLFIVSRCTGQRPTDDPSTSYAYNYYETVYICCSKDGTLLWQTAKDSHREKVA